MDAITRMQTEWECVRLTQAFAYMIDRRDYRGLTELFTDDGVWERHGQRLEGRAEILAVLEGRPANQFTRHVTTSFHFTEVSPVRACGTFFNVSYFTFEEGEPPFVYRPENALLLDFQDTFALTGEGWRFAERLTRSVFLAPALYDRLGPGGSADKH